MRTHRSQVRRGLMVELGLVGQVVLGRGVGAVKRRPSGDRSAETGAGGGRGRGRLTDGPWGLDHLAT